MTYHAFTGINGVLTDIGAIGGAGPSVANGISYAYDINNMGDVVGGSTFGGEHVNGALVDEALEHAFLYHSGLMVDLNSLIDPSLGITLDDAFQINDSGQILVGFNHGSRPDLGPITLGLLNLAAPAGAVPEPASWAMMMSGFGVIGATMRRRKRAPRAAPADAVIGL